MKSLVRQLDKFVKEKEKSSTLKKNSGLSPHITYGILSPTTAGTIDGAKLANNKRGGLNRNYSMTVSFYNPRFDNKGKKDISIRHEASMQAIAASSPSRHTSPKRDPILQNHSEAEVEFKSSLKLLPQSGKVTIFDDEPVYVTKSRGEFNHVDVARSMSPKIEGKRTFEARRDESPENQRRLRKACKSPQRNVLNPIVEGDPDGVKIIRQRKLIQEPSEMTQKLNDRKAALPSELGHSVKGRVFRDSKLTLAGVVGGEEPDSKLVIKRFSSPQHKRAGEMRGLLEYSFSNKYRDQNVSPKCNSFKISDAIRAGQE